MKLLRFDPELCTLCGACIDKCPFGAITMEKTGITLNENCRMCGVCVRQCQSKALYFEQKAGGEDKSTWNGILVYAEQERGKVHPVVFELIGEARKLAKKVGYKVYAVMVGTNGTAENAKELLPYGVDEVFVYGHEGFAGFKADCYADAVADCISKLRPSVVLVGGTSLGRSLAPRLSTRFHTGLTADCTKLEMKSNTDLVHSAETSWPRSSSANPVRSLLRSAIKSWTGRKRWRNRLVKLPSAMYQRIWFVPASRYFPRKYWSMCAPLRRKMYWWLQDAELTELLGGQLCFTRPMVEDGYGDTAHQIGLSGRTVKPKLILTFGVSGAIQFTACMNSAECIVAVNNDPEAPIFNIADIAIKDDLYAVLPEFLNDVKNRKDGE